MLWWLIFISVASEHIKNFGMNILQILLKLPSTISQGFCIIDITDFKAHLFNTIMQSRIFFKTYVTLSEISI